MFEKLLFLLGCAAILGCVKRGRNLVLLAASTLTIFWLQPTTTPQNLTFWLPAATISISVLTWFLTTPPETRSWRQNWPAALVLVAVIFLADLDHYFDPFNIFTVFTPRPQILAAVLGGLVLVFLALYLTRNMQHIWLALTLLTILLLFVLVKAPTIIQTIVTPPPILSWLGFSYTAFRLIHTIRDRQAGHLPAVTLGEYINYVIFFPALIAGPIDRLERFVPELRQPVQLARTDWLFIIQSIALGLFKKFVIADTLALIALNDTLTTRVHTTGWMWILVYAYALQIYFDFSGYSDVAIGMARLLGVRLPQNFASPYLKPDLTQFWNNWHITLTQWFRAYVFNPLTRTLRRANLPVWIILLLTQLGTMILIGLWHGITWNFMLWGLWHGCGLFIHNRWNQWSKGRFDPSALSPLRQKLLTLGGTLLTFHFVALGWVFFALSTPALAWRVLLILFGLST
jgi:D-alanyl-lipoteichoic acid acyltransferase DltB (MBOAT superfamily)